MYIYLHITIKIIYVCIYTTTQNTILCIVVYGNIYIIFIVLCI